MDADRRGRVQTVLGLIAPDDLGTTLMHEHVLCDVTAPALAARGDWGSEVTLENYHDIAYGRIPHAGKFRLTSIDVAVSELGYLRAAGGRSLVELTCGGMRPDPTGLAEVARRTGLHIVMGCGYYVEEHLEASAFDKTVDDFAQEIIGQIVAGAWGTSIRAGIIGEIGCQAPWTDLEKRIMHGAVIAQQETGAALNVHPGRHPDCPQEIVEFVRTRGGDVGRLIISHIERTIYDEERLARLADTGCVLELDLFGKEMAFFEFGKTLMPNDGGRLQTARRLIDLGYVSQVAISHDICTTVRLKKYGGHGYAHILRNVVPLMRLLGFSDHEITTILVDTPRRLLTLV